MRISSQEFTQIGAGLTESNIQDISHTQLLHNFEIFLSNILLRLSVIISNKNLRLSAQRTQVRTNAAPHPPILSWIWKRPEQLDVVLCDKYTFQQLSAYFYIC